MLRLRGKVSTRMMDSSRRFEPCTAHKSFHQVLLRSHRLVAFRTDHDVISVRIPERELLCSSIRVRVRLLFEPGDESTCPFQGHIEIVDAKEQEEPVARCRLVRAHQRRMLVRAPLVEAEQDSSIRIEELTKVIMGRSCLGLAQERLVPFEAGRHIAYADDRPQAFHDEDYMGIESCCSNGGWYGVRRLDAVLDYVGSGLTSKTAREDGTPAGQAHDQSSGKT